MCFCKNNQYVLLKNLRLNCNFNVFYFKFFFGHDDGFFNAFFFFFSNYKIKSNMTTYDKFINHFAG